jgi:ribosomal RNA assembly protein
MDGFDEIVYELKIPKERIAVLIGTKGKTKKELEDITESRIDINSKEGDITITGKDAVKLYSTKELIKAVGRGFNPEIAKLLIKQDYAFELIEIMDFARTKNDYIRLKGRIIGQEGKARRYIEKMTECNISVYGKTVAIIGEFQKVAIAKKAIETLLRGSPHSKVYRWLERKRRDFRQMEMLKAFDIPKE